MRTDTQRLDYVLTIVEQQDEEAADKLGAAYTLGFRGRQMVDAAIGARIIEPGQPMPELTALDLVGAELGRIRNVKGFSEERDDGYDMDDLAGAAACYLLPHLAAEEWPWGPESFKPSPDDRKKELTKGIALALCELDRLIRAERRESLELQADVCREMSEAACEPEDEQPQPREFKVGDRVKCNDPEIPELPKDAVGTLGRRTARGWTVSLDCQPNGSAYFREDEMEHADE